MACKVRSSFLPALSATTGAKVTPQQPDAGPNLTVVCSIKAVLSSAHHPCGLTCTHTCQHKGQAWQSVTVQQLLLQRCVCQPNHTTSVCGVCTSCPVDLPWLLLTTCRTFPAPLLPADDDGQHQPTPAAAAAAATVQHTPGAVLSPILTPAAAHKTASTRHFFLHSSSSSSSWGPNKPARQRDQFCFLTRGISSTSAAGSSTAAAAAPGTATVPPLPQQIKAATEGPALLYRQGLQSGMYRPDPLQQITVQKLQVCVVCAVMCCVLQRGRVCSCKRCCAVMLGP